MLLLLSASTSYGRDGSPLDPNEKAVRGMGSVLAMERCGSIDSLLTAIAIHDVHMEFERVGLAQ